MASPQQSHRDINNTEDALNYVLNVVKKIKDVVEDIEKWFQNTLKLVQCNIPTGKDKSHDLSKIEACNENVDNAARALNNSSMQDHHLTVETRDANEQNVLDRCKDRLDQILSDVNEYIEQCQKEQENRRQDMDNESKLVVESNTTRTNSDVMTNTTKGEYDPSRLRTLWNNFTNALGAGYLSCKSTHPEVDSQLYCPNTSNLLKSAMDKLSAKLKERFNEKGSKLNIPIYHLKDEFNKDIPLIVVCLRSSRSGTDVSNAIKGIETRSGVAVLIIHNVRIHALPSESTRTILTAQEYKTIDNIIDMGFVSDDGIYTCVTNDKALEDLTLFIETKSVKV